MRIGEVTVRAPDGTRVRRTYLHTPDVVGVVALHDDRIVLVREFRAAVGTTVTTVPMGKIPDGVDPRAQALTELAEETGYRARTCTPLGRLYTSPGWMNQVLHCWLATDLEPGRPAVPPDDDIEEDHIEVVTMAVAEIPDAIRSGVISDARTIAAIHLALCK